jgi:hypothetical protein
VVRRGVVPLGPAGRRRDHPGNALSAPAPRD